MTERKASSVGGGEQRANFTHEGKGQSALVHLTVHGGELLPMKIEQRDAGQTSPMKGQSALSHQTVHGWELLAP